MKDQESGRIRPAVNSDIPTIKAWLDAQPAEAESLAVNWRTTLDVYEKRGMFVYEHPATGEAVAYFWGSLNSTNSLLEVRHDMRGTGIGNLMVDALIESSMNAGEPLLLIECATVSSATFWERMGFVTENDRHRLYAKRILHLPRQIPPNTTPVDVTVRFLPTEADYQRIDLPALAEYRPVAGRDADGTIWLGERLAGFLPGPYSNMGDLVAEVIVDGKQAYLGKARHEEAEELGFERCMNGHAIERISWTRP